MFRNIKIKTKLVISSLLVSIFALGVVGGLSFNAAKKALENELFDKASSLSEEKELLLEAFLETQLANLRYLAQDPTVVRLTKKMVNFDGSSSEEDQQDAYQELKKHLTAFADFYGGPGMDGGTYADVMIADLTGYMWIGTYGPDEGGNEFDTEWFRESNKGIYLGDISYNPTMRQTTQIAAIPIKDGQKHIAILQLETNIRSINEIVNRPSERGIAGDSYILSSGNVILTDLVSDKKARGNHQINNIATQAARETGEEVALLYDNHNDVSVVGSVHQFSNLQGGHGGDDHDLLVDLEWLIVTELEVSETVGALRNQLILFSFLVILMTAILFYLMASAISKSIKKVRNVAIEIARGNMDVEVDISGKDEIAELSQAIEKMRTSLRVVMEEYERKLQ